MQKTLIILAIVVLCPRAGSPVKSTSEEPSVQLPADLERILTDYEIRWQAHDSHALAQLFATDGYVLTGGHPPVKGRTEIERVYAQAGGPLSLRAIAYRTEGKIGYIIGGFAKRKGDQDVGKFTLTLCKGQNGQWLIVSDMDNPNR
jgi:ketosteroid isomerase-like protein